jgi:hypothetical protein
LEFDDFEQPNYHFAGRLWAVRCCGFNRRHFPGSGIQNQTETRLAARRE